MSDMGSLLVATLGVLLGALSLGWQAATFVLTGGRIKAILKVGAFASNWGGMALTDANKITPNELKQMASQGFDRPIVAVEVRNVGRIPVTVRRWSLRTNLDMSFVPVAESIGPSLPHRLDTGEFETWAVDLDIALTLARTASKVIGDGSGTIRIVGAVELGDGRVRASREAFEVGT